MMVVYICDSRRVRRRKRELRYWQKEEKEEDGVKQNESFVLVKKKKKNHQVSMLEVFKNFRKRFPKFHVTSKERVTLLVRREGGGKGYHFLFTIDKRL